MLEAPVYRVAVRFPRGARRLLECACAALTILLAGCVHHGNARVAAPHPARIGSTETGIASWYGPNYDGRRAASGEIFDMQKLTAAHKKLPFQTWVEVTNLRNGKQVEVRITDRGPFVRGRIVDLSLAAARDIDMVREGTARVRLKVIPPPAHAPLANAAAAPSTPRAEDSSSAKGYAVQAGAFADRRRAEALRDSLSQESARIESPSGEPPLWRVLVGRALTAEQAAALASEVRRAAGVALVVEDR